MTDVPFSGLSALAAPQPNVKFPVLDPNDTTTAPAGAGGSDKEVTWSQVGAAGSPDVSRVFNGGHSYVSGFNVVEGGARWASRTAMVLHAEEVTYGHSSAVLAEDDASGNPGGYASILNGIAPRVANVASGPTTLYAPRTAQPYIPTSPVNVFFYGVNDLGFLGATTATNVAWFKMALRGLVCLSRAGGYFPDTHSSVAYGGSGGSHWTANTVQGQFGSPTNHSTATANDKVTITVPADFPGGEIDLLTIAKSGGTKWSTTVDGGAAAVLDGTSSAFGSASGRGNLVVQRLTGLAAGTHSIIMTMVSKDTAASAVFDSWLIAAPALPVTVLCTQPAVPSLPLTTSGAHTPITSTDVSALNVAIAALPAEFTDGNVVLADVAAAFAAASGNVIFTSAGSLYASDNLHPNTTGHGVIAATVLTAIRSAPLPVARFAPVGHLMRQVQANGAVAAWPAGGEPALNANWFIGGSPATGYFTKGADGRVEINLVLARTGSPTFAEVVFTLPPGYAPEAEKFLAGLSYNSGFTVGTAGILSVRPNGDVVWYAGDPTTLLQVGGSYYAGAAGF